MGSHNKCIRESSLAHTRQREEGGRQEISAKLPRKQERERGRAGLGESFIDKDFHLPDIQKVSFVLLKVQCPLQLQQSWFLSKPLIF